MEGGRQAGRNGPVIDERSIFRKALFTSALRMYVLVPLPPPPHYTFVECTTHGLIIIYKQRSERAGPMLRTCSSALCLYVLYG